MVQFQLKKLCIGLIFLFLSISVYSQGPPRLRFTQLPQSDSIGSLLLTNSQKNLEFTNNLRYLNNVFSVVGDANFDDNTLYVDATNNRVGIGTSSPSVKLHIEGGNIFAKKGSSSILFDEYNNGSILWMDGSDGDLAGGDYWGVYAQSSTLWGVNYAGGLNILNITSSGNVGIGDNGPSSKLQVAGDVRISGAGSAINGYDGGFFDYASNTLRIRGQSSTGGNIAFMTAANGASSVSTERMRITSGGNVGIGTSSPDADLHIAGTNDNNLIIQNTTYQASNQDTEAAIRFKVTASADDERAKAGIHFKNDGSDFGRGDLYFTVDSNNDNGNVDINDTKMMITHEGNVGIGTSSPSAKLEVSGGDVNFDSGTLYVDATNNRVGIGKTPSYLLDLYKEQTMSTTVDRALQLKDILTYSGTGAKYQQSIFASARQLVPTSSSNTGYLRGMTLDVTTGYGEAGNSGSLAEITGMQFQVGIESDNGNAPTVTNITGLNIYPFYQAGSVTNLYGLKLQSASTGGSVTNYYGIYQEDANAKNYFNGNVGIGTTNPLSPLHQVDVGANYTGEARFGGQSTAFGLELKYTQAGSTLGSIYASPTYDNANILFKLGAGLGNTEQLVLKGNGNVGIGTTSPSAKLDVDGGIRLSESGNLSGRLYPYTTTVGSGADATTTYIEAGSTSGYQSRITVAGGGAATDPNTIKFSVASNEAMRIDANGNVGIGTTNPAVKLTVLGDASNAGLEFGNSTTFTYIQSYDRVASVHKDLYFYASGAPTMVIKNSGNVGIGTQTPDGKLDVNGTSYFRDDLILYNTKKLYLDSGSDTYLTEVSANTMQFVTGGSEQLRITSSGKVGIGTTSPTTTLDVNSSNTIFAIRDSDGGVSFFGHDSSGGYWRTFTVDVHRFLKASGVESMRIDASGNVGIGTTSPSYKLHVNGSVAGVGAYNNLSDVNWKKNIYDLTDGLDKVLQLRPVTFNWKNEDYGDRINTGFIAQEVEDILPDMVTTADDGVKSLATTDLIPVLTKAIQEQQAMIETQEQKIQELETLLQTLVSRIETLENK